MDYTGFKQKVIDAHDFEGESIILGGAMKGGEVLKETFVRLPLKTFNRHGLIAGATGTGKTKTLQIIAEQLADKGVPSVVMDIKGDLSGIAMPSSGHPKIDERHEKIGFPFIPGASNVEFLSLSEEKGVRLRATVLEFGPVLFSKMLDLNDTQSSIISVLFKYCEDQRLPLLDLEDMKTAIQYITTTGKEDFQSLYGQVSTRSTGTIIRKIIELEQQGAADFFGERSFEVDDLLQKDSNGNGIVNILRVTDIQDKPKLFSTFMLQIMAEIYATFPEEGDLDKPKLVLFIDEAHLIFEEASPALMDQIEVIIKLIRSKGVGIFFVTQNPADVPDSVLGQLGMKVQHALRAFTAKDRKAIKLAAQNFPLTDDYDVETLLTELGIGEALVTALNEDGIPTPLIHTYLRAPQSRMDILSAAEMDDLVLRSGLVHKYNQKVDRDSAHEILQEKMEMAREEEHVESIRKQRTSARREKSTLEKVMSDPMTRQIGRTVARKLTRGILGVLGVKSSRRRRRWF